ncbi:hypothetical protein [Clostridium novyi]|uniref:hypothetical protein n=1 Tax=Clostridium novyi TaxID=1542 RepID=UPI0004D8AC61|nr:hypothetical protein [Clostridium novyi]KEI11772.1 hypothetical protein Z958_08575 [Clostridium novyi B str. NCTC 9691]
MKVNTVEQFKVLQYLKENFELNLFKVELLDRYSIKITDIKNESMIFRFEDNAVVIASEESVEKQSPNNINSITISGANTIFFQKKIDEYYQLEIVDSIQRKKLLLLNLKKISSKRYRVIDYQSF